VKRIIKSSSPKELTQWFNAQTRQDQGALNCRYQDLPSDVRAIVKQRLIQDQGHICCYTGIRINEERSHIEHLKPQSRYFANHEDVDYQNLVAAYPGTAAQQCRYGAHPKADWYDEDQFISPLSPQCETAFQFDLQGKIQAIDENPAAAETIQRLNLGDRGLTELRQQAIEAILFEIPLRPQQAADLLAKIYDRNAKGQFRPFFFVLKQACEQYIQKLERQQARQKAMRSANPSPPKKSKK
jgi:uncharacterized protein (TIGR02646 family)